MDRDETTVHDTRHDEHDHDHHLIENNYMDVQLPHNDPFLSLHHDHLHLPMVAPNPNYQSTSLVNNALQLIPDIGLFTNPFPSTAALLEAAAGSSGATSQHLNNPCLPRNTTGSGGGFLITDHGADQSDNCAKFIRGRMGNRRNKRVVPRRVAFHTRSTEDVLDDGYRWRKYGQKAVKNSVHPRCTHHTCNVKKQIQRLAKDTSVVVTTYEGVHNHPCEKLMETLTPLLKQLHFLSRF